MNKKLMLEGLQAMMAGLLVITNAVEESMTPTTISADVVPEVKKEVVKKEIAKKVTPVVVEEEEEETVSEHTVPTSEELIALGIHGLKELATEMGVEIKKNDNAKALCSRIMKEEEGEKIVEALEELGYFTDEDEFADEEDSEDSEEEGNDELATELATMATEELAGILADAGISAKGKKQALIDKILKGVEEGTIELGEDEESEERDEDDVEEEVEEEETLTVADILEELDDDQIKELATALEISITVTKKIAGKVKKSPVSIDTLKASIEAHADVEDKLAELGYLGEDEESEEEEVEDDSDFEASEERVNAESEVEANIRKQYKLKKLRDADIKKVVEKYYELDNTASKEDILDTYIDIKINFVADDGSVRPEEEAYVRNGEEHCCGTTLDSVDDGFTCEICGSEYGE